MFLSQAAIPYLLETHGSIVNVCSNAGLMGQALLPRIAPVKVA